MGLPLSSLGRSTWTELAPPRPALVVLLPLGATEQHGPHLPLDTDTRVAVAVAEAVADRHRGRVVVAPALAYGASGEHAGFAGTLSLGLAALELVVVELARSMAAPLHALVLVNGHGGNVEALVRAVATLRGEGRRVVLWSPRIPGGDAHAGRTETSLVLALDPALVRVERAQAGDTRPLAELMDRLRAGGVAAVSTNGVLGDPAGASAEEGRALLAQLVDDLDRIVGPRVVRAVADEPPRPAGPALA